MEPVPYSTHVSRGLWLVAVVLVVLMLPVGWLVSGSEPLGDWLSFRASFLFDPTGITLSMMVGANFVLAFILAPPLARRFIARIEVGRITIARQFFLLSLATYVFGASLGVWYLAAVDPKVVPAAQSLLLLCVPMMLAGLVKLYLVDVPDLRELVATVETAATPDHTP